MKRVGLVGKTGEEDTLGGGRCRERVHDATTGHGHRRSGHEFAAGHPGIH